MVASPLPPSSRTEHNTAMPFHFVCPYCFKKTLVDETMAGESGPCAGCGKTITVPAAPEKPAEGTAPVQSEYITPREERVERRFAAWILKALGLVAVVGVLTASVIYLMWPTLHPLFQAETVLWHRDKETEFPDSRI